ncbi:MAG TPA: hypothetical protein VEW28_01680 [Candidatus Kapabacteria bacterium]|nr:hypothetical protein [Candidatus Kapabacteria bacterium]
MSAIAEALQLVRPHPSERILSREATRYFLVWFLLLSVVLYGAGSFILFNFTNASFRTACYSGMALCTVTSLISFVLTEWAIDKPDEIFLGIALGSIFVRLFTLLFAFAIGEFILKLHVFGMVTGMFVSYFSYLIVEISYFHKKQLVRGQ